MSSKTIEEMTGPERQTVRVRLLERRDELQRHRDRITLEQAREPHPVTTYDVTLTGAGVQLVSGPRPAYEAEGYTTVMREGGLLRREAFLKLALMLIDAQFAEVDGELAKIDAEQPPSEAGKMNNQQASPTERGSDQTDPKTEGLIID